MSKRKRSKNFNRVENGDKENQGTSNEIPPRKRLRKDDDHPNSYADKDQQSHQLQLPLDVFRKIVSQSMQSRNLLTYKILSKTCAGAVYEEVKFASSKKPIKLDIAELFSYQNPLTVRYYNADDPENFKAFHDDLQKLCDLLEGYQGMESCFELANLSPAGLGWFSEGGESGFTRCPWYLQKRLADICDRFSRCNAWTYSSAFMRPTRFFGVFYNKLHLITTLHLGDVKALSVMKLKRHVFPKLKNLLELSWHNAKLAVLTELGARNTLTKLCISVKDADEGFDVARLRPMFPALKSVHFGQHLSWRPVSEECVLDREEQIAMWTKLSEIGFDDAPRNFFTFIAKFKKVYEKVTIGCLTQDLTHLCLTANLHESLAKLFLKEEHCVFRQHMAKIKCLNVNLLAELFTPLCLNLPFIMDMLNKMLELDTLNLSVSCERKFEHENVMDVPWTVETPKYTKKAAVVHGTFTEFSLHFQGFCLLDDLNVILPPVLRRCSISLDLALEYGGQSVRSLLKFIEALANVNAFPDLEELHVQVWGIRCMELLVDSIAENVGSCLRHVSVIAMPMSDDVAANRLMMGKLAKACRKAVSIGVSAPFLVSLMGEERSRSPNWKYEIHDEARAMGFPHDCELRVESLPRENEFRVKENYPSKEISESAMVPKVHDDEEEDEEEEEEDDDDVDSFLCDDESEEDEDELDELERRLEDESDRRHNGWERREAAREQQVGSNSPRAGVGEEDIDEDDIVDFDNLGDNGDDEEEDNEYEERLVNPYIDDEAIHTDDERSSDEDSESEGSSPDSDDEALIGRGAPEEQPVVELRNRRVRRVVVSESEDE